MDDVIKKWRLIHYHRLPRIGPTDGNQAQEPCDQDFRPKTSDPEPLFIRFEHRSQRVISRHKFAYRMVLAVCLWGVLTFVGLTIGMIGYSYFESMSLTDAFVNAAMILSGMGPLGELKTTGGKIFAGTYAIFSGLIIVIATGFVLAPVFHRVLHRFHVEQGKQD